MVEYVVLGVVKLPELFKCSLVDDCSFRSSSKVFVVDDFDPDRSLGVSSRE